MNHSSNNPSILSEQSTQNTPSELMRLNQFVAKYLGVSRRQADQAISNYQVLVNQESAVLGQKIDPQNDVVEILGGGQRKLLEPESIKIQVIVFYKPIFCLTTRYDPQKRKTLYDFLPKNFHNLKPAGRLDYMSEGVLVMSNDGQVLDELCHPKNNHIKKYLVATARPIDREFLEMAKTGNMEIDEYQINPVNIKKMSDHDLVEYDYLKINPDLNVYEFTLSEGRNNQIRKMMDMFGHRVTRLIRTQQGDYKLTKELFENRFIVS